MKFHPKFKIFYSSIPLHLLHLCKGYKRYRKEIKKIAKCLRCCKIFRSKKSWSPSPSPSSWSCSPLRFFMFCEIGWNIRTIIVTMERERIVCTHFFHFILNERSIGWRWQRGGRRRGLRKWEGKMSEIKNCTMMMELYRIFFGLALEIFIKKSFM